MSEDHLLVVIGLMTMLFGALGINHFLYQKEQAALERRRLFQAFKQKAETTLDTLATLKQTPCSVAIIELLNQHVVETIARLKELAPEDDYLNQLQSHASRSQENPQQKQHPTSDKAIREAQASFRQTLRILKRLQQQSKLSAADYARHHDELAWLYCVVEADAHIAQGKKLLKTGKRAVALTHFKHAKVKLSAVSVRAVTEEKNARLQTLQELIQQADPYSKAAFSNLATGVDQEQSSRQTV